MDFVEQLKSSVDIVKTVGEYVRLKRAGSTPRYMGLCPFHTEKTPSFSVHGSHQYYKCFGCGLGARQGCGRTFFSNGRRFKAPAPEISLRRTVYNARSYTRVRLGPVRFYISTSGWRVTHSQSDQDGGWADSKFQSGGWRAKRFVDRVSPVSG